MNKIKDIKTENKTKNEAYKYRKTIILRTNGHKPSKVNK